MRYKNALVISLLLHGLAFAGTGWVISVGSLKGKAARLQQTICVDVQWSSLPCSKPEQYSPSSQETKGSEVIQEFSGLSHRDSPHNDEIKSRKIIQKAGNIPSPSGLAENTETLDTNAVLIPFPSNPTPTYPEEARRRGLKGEMVLTLTIDAAGSVVKIDVEQGKDIAPLLKEAAFEAVKKWRFIRHDKSTKPLSVTLPVVFNLEN